MDSAKIEQAIKFIQSIPQDGPIELCYSTGKDSDVILELARMAGIPFDPIYKNTTCDPKGSIRHARENGVRIVQPRKNMLQLIEENGWASRYTRFCCSELKEYKIHDRAILGIRRSESTARAQRYHEPEQCRIYSKNQRCRQYFPILYWTDNDVADFIRLRGIQCHPHYYDEQGNFHIDRRVGCIGCPLAAGNGVKDFKMFPWVFRARVKAYIRWWNNHPDSKTAKTFANPYDSIYSKLFCSNLDEFRTQTTGFFPHIEPKEFLENYFNIKL